MFTVVSSLVLVSLLLLATTVRTFVVLSTYGVGLNAQGMQGPRGAQLVRLHDQVLREQPTFGLRVKTEPVTLLDVVGVLGRFKNREEFFEGVGYSRRSIGDGQLLTNARFFERIKNKPFMADAWPIDKTTGRPVGLAEGEDQGQLLQHLQSAAVSPAACYAIFTSFAKGAGNGCAWPVQVDEELGRWLVEDETVEESRRIFDLEAFERTLAMGKLQVAIGWFLFLGLQGFAIYHLFLRVAVKQLAPDWYDVIY